MRWKGPQLTETKWDYCIDIKQDFWLQQEAPSPKEVKEMSKELHSHLKSVKNMNKSPIFGVSKVERPMAKLNSDDKTLMT